MFDLCPPAIIYLIFSLIQIIIDTFKGLYNVVVIKTIITIFVTILLNVLCLKGLSVVSWIFVFIPFILMSVIVVIILYVFGLNVTTGKLNRNYNTTKAPSSSSTTTTPINNSNTTTDSYGNIIVYNPAYNPLTNPVYYNNPNIIIRKPPTSPSPITTPMPTTTTPMPTTTTPMPTTTPIPTTTPGQTKTTTLKPTSISRDNSNYRYNPTFF